MARIFVSYARIDIVLAEQIIETLRQRYGHANVWYDQELHNRGGENWWEEILDAIGEADIFVYLLSKESVESPYCQAEFEEAQRLKKRLIFIQVRDRTPLPDTIASRQYADMSKGINNLKTWTSLYNSIEHQISKIPKRKLRPLKPERTPRPEQSESSQARPDDAPAETTPKLEPITPDEIPPPPTPWLLYVALIVFVLVVAGIGIALLSGNNAGGENPAPTIVAQGGGDGATDEARLVPTTAIAQGGDDGEDTNNVGTAFLPSETPEPTPTPTEEPTVTDTPTITPTPTDEPTPDLIAAAQQVLQQQTAEAIIAEATATSARATEDESLRQTQSANQTATATLWTPTFTPDLTMTIESILTAWAHETATQQSADATATATLWTPTPTNTPTPTFTPSNTPTSTPTPTPTLTPLEEALQRARTFTGTQNSDWQPFEQDFNGVTMVLVPAGCFMMGSDNGDSDERPVHEQCFDEPFWIDKYEVTNEQYGSTGCTDRSSQSDQPRNCVSWFDANDYCQSRNAQLPTEAQWEYAARGVESWIYPWGNDFVGDNAVYSSNSGSRTADVGSRPNGASWVGAMDMAGNVWEWTSSLFELYPYDADDGREQDTGDRTDVLRVLRGGSFGSSSSYLRSADRVRINPNVGSNYSGLRCLRSY